MCRFLIVLLVLSSNFIIGQTTKSLEECESLFLKNNALLLAEHFNIEASQAAVIQAKIWDLPYFTADINALNPSKKRLFDIGNEGQKGFAIQQLIYLGNKKHNEIEFAKSNIVLAKLEYEGLLINLRYQLRQSYYEIYFNQQKAKSITIHINNIDSLIHAYKIQYEKGNVPLKDVVRLQSLLMSFKNNLIEIQRDIINQKDILKLLIFTDEEFDVFLDETIMSSKFNLTEEYNENLLYEKALEKNPEYLSSKAMLENNELMYKWQKSLSTPDLTLGLSYDQIGGAFANQVNVTAGISIPLWNINKGNIKMANARMNGSLLLIDQKKKELRSKVSSAFKQLRFHQKEYLEMSANFQNFEEVYNGIFENFQKRNITLMEFTDFMETYNQSIISINELKKRVVLNREDINYLVSSIIL